MIICYSVVIPDTMFLAEDRNTKTQEDELETRAKLVK